MIKHYFLLSLLVFANLSLISLCVAGEFNPSGGFSSYSSSGDIFYLKKEPSGCITSLRYRENSSSMDLTYGECQAKKHELEPVLHIANSFVKIIKHNKLTSKFIGMEYLNINISWKISHWPLIDTINNSESWPSNIFEVKDLKNIKTSEFRKIYKEHLQKEILKPAAYLPFSNAIQQLDCSLTLNDDFADPLFMPDHTLTNQMLVKWGIFQPDETTKEIYPLIKGSIKFNLSCQ